MLCLCYVWEVLFKHLIRQYWQIIVFKHEADEITNQNKNAAGGKCCCYRPYIGHTVRFCLLPHFKWLSIYHIFIIYTSYACPFQPVGVTCSTAGFTFWVCLQGLDSSSAAVAFTLLHLQRKQKHGLGTSRQYITQDCVSLCVFAWLPSLNECL